MGFHICEYATGEQAERAWKDAGLEGDAPYLSSGDLTMKFESGNQYRVPDMLPLYVALGWTPPSQFMEDVMNSPLAESKREQTRSISAPVEQPVGYLRKTSDTQGTPASDVVPGLPGTLAQGLPEGFLAKLTKVMHEAALGGFRMQTKSLDIGRR